MTLGQLGRNSALKIKREISNGDKNEVKDYLASVYDVKKKNIRINEN